MVKIGEWIARVLAKPDDLAVARAVEREVLETCAGFPLFAREPVVRA
jgi:glycine/serine hydroxymethyltransferase